MPAPDAIRQLVEEFRANDGQYTQSSYKEYSVRSEFISPLFEALGWPVTSTQGVAPEVVLEDTIHAEDAQRRRYREDRRQNTRLFLPY